MTTIERHRTAIERAALSRPVSLALADGLLAPGMTVFDYGCGRGGDLQRLAELGFACAGWDPVYRPESPLQPADAVNLGYVLNVIDRADERAQTLRAAWNLARSLLIVAARLDHEAREVRGLRYEDGVLTRRGTFQRFFTQEELRAFIDTTLGVRSVAAAPGVFYVFRDESRAQAWLAARFRRLTVPRQVRRRDALDDGSRLLLDPIVAFLETRGRVPDEEEIDKADALRTRFGSLRTALRLAAQLADTDTYAEARRTATEDLTIYLALAAFGGRPRFSTLPRESQRDIKAFFDSYRAACSAADELLFRAGDRAAIDEACRQASFGKLTHEALYVHASALTRLSPLLRVYEGCARVLTGTIDGVSLIKLNRFEPKVSYLVYPHFDTLPHPELAVSVRADLRRLDVRVRDFRSSHNPPILHRKETFVPDDYPERQTFAQLTEQEERAGLFSDPTTIGTREGWRRALETRGLAIEGHRLRHAGAKPFSPSQR
jgi:DNA phosphorothioation-associated putative methyltransferase